VEAAGVADRVTVLHAIANRPGIASGVVRWNFRGGEAATHHRYIGNAQRIPVDAQDEETVDCVSLADLLAMAGGAVDFVKIDCEGGEYDVLADPVVVQKVREYRGEHHAGLEGIVDLLGASHHVTLTGGVEAFGAFRAVAR
jgi:FkbM family methyltransferase